MHWLIFGPYLLAWWFVMLVQNDIYS